MQALRDAMQITATYFAPVPFGSLEWLVHLMRVEVKDYTASAPSSTVDAPIASTPPQVRAGEG